MAGLNLAQADEDLGETLPYEVQAHFMIHHIGKQRMGEITKRSTLG